MLVQKIECFFAELGKMVAVAKKGKKVNQKGAKKAGGKKKKQTLRFNIECKNPVEDGILKVEDFVSFIPLFLFLHIITHRLAWAPVPESGFGWA